MPNKIKISLRMDRKLKDAAQKVAKRQHRTLTSLIEVQLAELCKQHGEKVV